MFLFCHFSFPLSKGKDDCVCLGVSAVPAVEVSGLSLVGAADAVQMLLLSPVCVRDP